MGQGQASDCLETTSPRALAFVWSLNGLPVVALADVSKAGETKCTAAFAQRRGTVTKVKSLVTCMDATKHAAIEKLGGVLEK